jgi:ApbE superfamily uncharacterized protein (UPF0280 family)
MGKLSDRTLYRRFIQAFDLVSFQVTIKETDLLILAERDLTGEARELVLAHRYQLEEHIARHPEFRASLSPLPEWPVAAPIVRLMGEAGRLAAVGPMAAVAGAVSELVGEGLREYSQELLIENGGDLYLAGKKERVVAIFTGESELGTRLGLRVGVEERPLGICTSSGRLGHSLSLGEASTATIIARSAALADAAATATGNVVRGTGGVETGMELARRIPGVLGAVIVHRGRIGAWGQVELVPLEDGGAG